MNQYSLPHVWFAQLCHGTIVHDTYSPILYFFLLKLTNYLNTFVSAEKISTQIFASYGLIILSILNVTSLRKINTYSLLYSYYHIYENTRPLGKHLYK